MKIKYCFCQSYFFYGIMGMSFCLTRMYCDWMDVLYREMGNNFRLVEDVWWKTLDVLRKNCSTDKHRSSHKSARHCVSSGFKLKKALKFRALLNLVFLQLGEDKIWKIWCFGGLLNHLPPKMPKSKIESPWIMKFLWCQLCDLSSRSADFESPPVQILLN